MRVHIFILNQKVLSSEQKKIHEQPIKGLIFSKIKKKYVYTHTYIIYLFCISFHMLLTYCIQNKVIHI